MFVVFSRTTNHLGVALWFCCGFFFLFGVCVKPVRFSAQCRISKHTHTRARTSAHTHTHAHTHVRTHAHTLTHTLFCSNCCCIPVIVRLSFFDTHLEHPHYFTFLSDFFLLLFLLESTNFLVISLLRIWLGAVLEPQNFSVLSSVYFGFHFILVCVFFVSFFCCCLYVWD